MNQLPETDADAKIRVVDWQQYLGMLWEEFNEARHEVAETLGVVPTAAQFVDWALLKGGGPGLKIGGAPRIDHPQLPVELECIMDVDGPGNTGRSNLGAF